MLTGSCHCGAVSWTFSSDPGSATACNCTICRRYGVLWIYGWEGEDLAVTGTTTAYRRADGGALEFHFCPTCGNTVSWRLAKPDRDGRTRSAVNLRLSDDPGAVMAYPIDHFDGLDNFEDEPRDHRTVRDMWY